MKTKNTFQIIVFFFMLLSYHNSQAQCCSSGNPIGGDGSNDVLNKKILRVFLSEKSSYSTDYYEGNHKSDIPFDINSNYNFANLSLSYGLMSKLSVHTELGYFINKTQNINFGERTETIKSSGIGDLLLQFRFILLENPLYNNQLVLGAGFKSPIGAFNEKINGITIPLSLQPSAGAFKFNASIFYSNMPHISKWGFNALSYIEISQKIDKGFLEYKYGTYLQLSMGAIYKITENLTLVTNLKTEVRLQDKRELDITVEASGSKILYINPSLIYKFKTSYYFIINSDIPIYKYVNGLQLTNKFGISLGIRKDIKFIKKMDLIENNAMNL